MSSRLLLTSLTLLFLMAAPLAAAEIREAVITSAVVDREPVDSVEVYPGENGRLYCFTRVVGALEDTFVTHLWYRGSELVSKVELPVRSSDWRTWSTKSLLPGWTGSWRVEVRDAAGTLLRELTFEVR